MDSKRIVYYLWHCQIRSFWNFRPKLWAYPLPAFLTQRQHKGTGANQLCMLRPAQGLENGGVMCAVKYDSAGSALSLNTMRRRTRLRIPYTLCLLSYSMQIRVRRSSINCIPFNIF